MIAPSLFSDPCAARLLPDWRDLLGLSDDELARLDIGVMNLACAAGLPGSEVIDVSGCLEALDRWAEGIRRQTEFRIDSEFRQNPERFDHSEPLYRMVKLVCALQQHCGVRFDPAKRDAKPDDPFELHEHFIYGPIQGPGGTCATLPILFAAVGRRIGYPIRLALAPQHMYCRWDDPDTGVKVNIEGSCGMGLHSYPDDYYRTWPKRVTQAEVRLAGYFDSLSPREELAHFVGRRGRHWWECGNYRRAASALILSGWIDQTRPVWYPQLVALEREWEESLLARRPAGFPKVEICVNIRKRRWPALSWEWEKRLRFLEAAENVLNDQELEEKCWAPLRAGTPPAVALPETIVVDCTGDELCTIHP